MNGDTRATVLRLLAAGWTVARVMDATTWPRRQVEQLAAGAGMLRRPSTDTWIATHSQPRMSTALDELLARAEVGPRRTRDLAGRVRRAVLELEAALVAENARIERDGYDAAAVREWARSAGLNPPTTGRYLPAHIVAAWKSAGRP